jgi:hypothetical protein
VFFLPFPLDFEIGRDVPASRTGPHSLPLFRALYVVIFRNVLWGNKSLFEAAINFAQFPEDQNKKNRDHEQQELDVHL